MLEFRSMHKSMQTCLVIKSFELPYCFAEGRDNRRRVDHRGCKDTQEWNGEDEGEEMGGGGCSTMRARVTAASC